MSNSFEVIETRVPAFAEGFLNLFTVDHQAAVVGGRNVGDECFVAAAGA